MSKPKELILSIIYLFDIIKSHEFYKVMAEEINNVIFFIFKINPKIFAKPETIFCF